MVGEEGGNDMCTCVHLVLYLHLYSYLYLYFLFVFVFVFFQKERDGVTGHSDGRDLHAG